VADRAILVARQTHVVERRRLAVQNVRTGGVTFKAKGSDRRTHEHLRVVGPMRLVAALAILDFQDRMLKDERPFLFPVAARAGHLTGNLGAELPAVDAAVRLVAVDAAHRIFLNPVVIGLREISAALDVAAEAEIVGLIFQQAGHARALVDRVAIDAHEAHLGMRAAREGGQLMILVVTGKALRAVFLLAVAGLERDDLGLVAVVRRVIFPRAVARLAGVAQVELGAFFQNRVRVFVEGFRQVFVADGAVFVFDAPGFGGLGFLRGGLGQQPVRAAGQNSRQGCHRQRRQQVFQSA